MHTEQAWTTVGITSIIAATRTGSPYRLPRAFNISKNRVQKVERWRREDRPWRVNLLSSLFKLLPAAFGSSQFKYTRVYRTGQRPTTKYQYIPQSSILTWCFAVHRPLFTFIRTMSSHTMAPNTWAAWVPMST